MIRFTSLLPLTALLLHAGPAAGKCRLMNQTRKVEKRASGRCDARMFTGVIVDNRSKVKVSLKAEELRCGATRLGSWARVKKLGLRTCKENARSEMKELDYAESFKVMLLGQLLGVDAESGGFTGGAHGTARVKRRTYHFKTGKLLTLKQLYPKKYKQLLVEAQKKFKAHKQHEDYSFDALAFAPFMGKIGIGVVFAMPHAVETARGTTLKLRLLSGPAAVR